jgi:DNA ligase-1
MAPSRHEVKRVEDLSRDPLTFPVPNNLWTPLSKPAPYSLLSDALDQLSATRSRIAILNIITNILRILLSHDTKSVLPTLYLMSNTLAPPYATIELGLGPSIISKAIQQVSGLTGPALKKLYNRTGDPGDVAFEAKSSVRTLVPHARLTIRQVYDTLIKIATSKGSGAMKQKQTLVEKLLVAASGEESRFVVRTLSQHIRVGATRTTVLTAFARAIVITPPSSLSPEQVRTDLYADPELLGRVIPLSGKKKALEVDTARLEVIDKLNTAESLLKRVFVQHPNYEDLCTAILATGLNDLPSHVPLTVGKSLICYR